MSTWRFVFNSITHYWRGYLGVLLGCVVAAMVLTGSLIVGDSVKASLYGMVDARLNDIGFAMTTQGRFFEAANRDYRRTFPALIVHGTLSNSERTARANNVQVIGVEKRFWWLASEQGKGPENNDYMNKFVLGDALADHLKIKAGDTVLLRMENPGELSGDSLLASGGEVFDDKKYKN